MHTTDKQTRNDQSKPERILDAVLVAIVVLPYSEAERSAYFFLPPCFLVELVEMIVLFYTNLFLLYISIFFMLFSPLGECCFFRK